MPELPEVETTVKGLNKKVLGRTFVDVWTDWEKTIKKPGFKMFKKEIAGKKIIKARRRAKNVIIDLLGGYSLLVHMKMTGHLLYGKWKKDPMNDFLHVVFFLDNKEKLALSDLRKFAKVELWKTGDLEKELEKLGPEP